MRTGKEITSSLRLVRITFFTSNKRAATKIQLTRGTKMNEDEKCEERETLHADRGWFNCRRAGPVTAAKFLITNLALRKAEITTVPLTISRRPHVSPHHRHTYVRTGSPACTMHSLSLLLFLFSFVPLRLCT